MGVKMDNQFIILDCIQGNQQISQRQLAEKTGLSLGSINLLLKKMLREGLIKVENIPANRVMYMLTPQGMAEKANKTYRYIKHYYNYINQTKERVKEILSETAKEYSQLCVILKNDEISQLMRIAIEELDLTAEKISINCAIENIGNKIVIVTESTEHEFYSGVGLKVVNLLELI